MRARDIKEGMAVQIKTWIGRPLYGIATSEIKKFPDDRIHLCKIYFTTGDSHFVFVNKIQPYVKVSPIRAIINYR
jgi:hypothetical protein